uniref:RING-type domain-containing protein n=1 Tax=Pelusios castaneus TaxID=367368 RepID=A0A8C8VGE4_9SAUR
MNLNATLQPSMEEVAVVAESLEEELSCPICLDIYKEPVSLSCGHTFCKECIQEVIDTHQQKPWGTYSCPICQVDLVPFPKLQKNFQLCRIVEKFLGPPSKEDSWQEEKPANRENDADECRCDE